MKPLHELWISLETHASRWMWGLVGLAAVLRALLFWVEGIGDEEPRTLEIARALAGGGGLTLCNQYFPFCSEGDATAQVGPLPALLFAGMIRLLGDGALLGIVGLQLLMGVVTTGLVYAISARLFDCRRTAAVAALACATYPHLARLELYPREETLFTLLTCVGVLLAIVAVRRERTWAFAGAGAVLAAASLSRAALVYFPPILALATPLLVRGPLVRRLGCAALVLVGLGVVLTPWVLRNQAAFGAFVPGGTLTGYNLLRHNHIVAGDDYLRYVRGPEAERAVQALIARRSDLTGSENEAQMDRVYREEALAILREHPDRYLLLSAYRLLPLFTDYGVNATPLPLFWRAVGAENLILLLLAAWTVLRHAPGLLRGREPALAVVVLLLGYYIAGHMLANAKMRYAVPILPLVMALASHTIVRMLAPLLAPAGHPAGTPQGTPSALSADL